MLISARTPWANRSARLAAAVKVLRTLHSSERPLNASEVARSAGLYRGTAYNILRTLQAEGFVGYDEATRSYSVSLHILGLADGALRRSGLIDIARPLMHAVADAHDVTVYLSKVLGPSSMLLLDWVAGPRPDPYVTVGRPHPSPAGASGVVIAAFGNSSEPELEALLSHVKWHRKPSFSDFMARVKEAKQAGFSVGPRHDVPRCHARVGAGSVAVLGVVADPHRRRAFARSRRRCGGRTEPRPAIHGGPALG